MKMHRCNRFHSCNAPICPLDDQYLTRKYLKGEPICFYMAEAVKENGKDKIRGAIGISGSIKVQLCLDTVLSTHRPPKFGKLARKLRLSMTTKSRLRLNAD